MSETGARGWSGGSTEAGAAASPIRRDGEDIRTTDSRRAAGVLVAVLGLLLVAAAAPLAGGILGALVLAVLLERPYQTLSARIGPGRAAGLLSIAALLLLFIPAVLIGRIAWIELRSVDWERLGATWSRELARAGDLPANGVGDVIPRLAASLTSAVGDVASWVAGGAARSALNLAVMFLCLYFALRSGDRIWIRVQSVLPFSPQSTGLLGDQLQRVTRATVLGTLVSAVLQGISMAAGFFFAGLPGPVLWGVVTVFASMVPVLGSALVWVPAVVVLALEHAGGPALTVVVFGWLIPSVIDNVARATVSRRHGNVHPMTTLLGSLIGIPIFGIVGLIVGPLMIAGFVELLDLYQREYGAAHHESGDAPPIPTPAVPENVP
jgi:predicted PurR-regulated permease PerM